MFKNAKVGDDVWSIRHGWGVIGCTALTNEYCIKVRFDNGKNDSYTVEGKEYVSDELPILYWDEVHIDPPKKPLPDLPVDTKLIVWDEGDDRKNRAHFHSFLADGSVGTWCDGKTSHTGTEYKAWDNWELHS